MKKIYSEALEKYIENQLKVNQAEQLKKRNAMKKHVLSGKVAEWYKKVINGDDSDVQGKGLCIKHENKKLFDEMGIGFLIWSIPAVLSCPNATEDCMTNCYARAFEGFPSVKSSRVRNWLAAKSEDFTEQLCKALKDMLYTKKGTLRKCFQGKQLFFRIHESGDFFNTEYLLAWYEIAKRFPEIRFYTYTKSFDLMEKFYSMRPSNFQIRASIWDDTCLKDLYIIKSLHMPVYIAETEEEYNRYDAINQCDCKSCAGCGNKCENKSIDVICTKIH